MISLLLQIALYLGAMFVLGILLGWLLWGRGRSAAIARARAIEDAAQSMIDSSGDAKALADALARTNAEKSALEKKLGNAANG